MWRTVPERSVVCLTQHSHATALNTRATWWLQLGADHTMSAIDLFSECLHDPTAVKLSSANAASLSIRKWLVHQHFKFHIPNRNKPADQLLTYTTVSA